MNELPVAVILGAGMGGRGVANALAGKAHLVIVDRDQAFAQAAADPVIAAGGTAEAHAVDLTDLEAVQKFRDDLLDRHGRVDAVVHLVGGWAGSQTVDAEAIEQFHQLLAGAVTTVQTTSVAFRDALLAAPAGRYFMVTSGPARHPKQTVAAYTAVKGAAERWVQALGDAFADSPARAVILAVVALTDAAARAKSPNTDFSRHTDTADLGAAVWEYMQTPGEPSVYVDLSPDA
jgi:NAD(P)-dependent dehydrogenase (short-subunit alcohol dehydrogenase family)